jgi:hypothetical protein
MCVPYCDCLTQLGLQLGGQVLLNKKLNGYTIAILKYRLIIRIIRHQSRVLHQKTGLYHLGFEGAMAATLVMGLGVVSELE